MKSTSTYGSFLLNLKLTGIPMEKGTQLPIPVYAGLISRYKLVDDQSPACLDEKTTSLTQTRYIQGLRSGNLYKITSPDEVIQLAEIPQKLEIPLRTYVQLKTKKNQPNSGVFCQYAYVSSTLVPTPEETSIGASHVTRINLVTNSDNPPKELNIPYTIHQAGFHGKVMMYKPENMTIPIAKDVVTTINFEAQN